MPITKKRLTLRDVRAKCKDCCCDYVDGRLDCEMPDCSLYPFMPYGNYLRQIKAEKAKRPKQAVPEWLKRKS